MIKYGIPNGAVGERFVSHLNRKFNPELFHDIELRVLREVAGRFKKVNTSDLIEISHRERAWIDNEADRKVISYKYAFDLSAI